MSEDGLTWTDGTRKLSELTPQRDNPCQIRKENAEQLQANGIYYIVNLNDGRGTAYIGSTGRGFGRRWQEHVNFLNNGVHTNPFLQAAWNKYGGRSFAFGVLEIVLVDDELIEREQCWMDTFTEVGRVYNMHPCVNSPTRGTHLSDEHKQKIRDAHKGKPHNVSAEGRQRMSDAWRGKMKVFSDETRRKISESARLRMSSPAARARLSEVHSRPHASFIHKVTGEIIPKGVGLTRMCKERGLSAPAMCNVAQSKARSHKGWVLLEPVK